MMNLPGRPETIAEHLEHCRRPIQNFFIRKGVSWEDSEDLVQETLLAICRNSEAFRGESAVMTWVFSVASNVWRNHLRRQQTLKRSSYSEVSLDEVAHRLRISEEEEGGSLWDLVRREERENLWQAIEKLPHQSQMILHLYLQGRKYREIAEILKISIPSVKSALVRSRNKLRHQLSQGSDNFLELNPSTDTSLSSATLVEAYQRAHADSLRQSTMRTYLRHIQDFLEFAESTSPGELALLAGAYHRKLEKETKSPSLIAQATAAIRSLLRWHSPDSVVPAAGSVRPTREKRKGVLTEEEIRELYKVSSPSVKDAALVTLMLEGGLRPDEVAEVLPEDFSLEPDGNRTLSILNDQKRQIRLSSEAMKKLAPLLEAGTQASNGLFQAEDRGAKARNGVSMTGRAIRKRLSKLMAKAGIEKKRANSQTLRDTFAVRFLSQGGTVQALQVQLGHRGPTIAKRYASQVEGFASGLR